MNADVLTSCSTPFFPRTRLSRGINTAPTRAHYAAPGIYSFGIKEKRKKKRKKKEKRKKKKGKKEAEGEKKISHKEPRVKWFKVGKNGPRKADSLQSESRSVRAAWEAERMDETRRKDEPSKMGVHRRKSFGHRFGFMSGGPGLAGAGWFEICMDLLGDSRGGGGGGGEGESS